MDIIAPLNWLADPVFQIGGNGVQRPQVWSPTRAVTDTAVALWLPIASS